MKTIWKFPLEVTDRQIVTMPEGARILDVQVQNDTPCLWAVVNERAEPQRRVIVIYGIGGPVPDTEGTYIGTFQMYGGAAVFHAFERTLAEHVREQRDQERAA